VKVTIEIEHFVFWFLAVLLRKKPTAPTKLSGVQHMSNVQLAWTPPVLKPGQSAIKNFRVYAKADGAPSFGLIGEPTDPSFLDENVAAGTWTYQVTTVDSKDRESAASNQATVTVIIEPDSVAPSPPTDLTAAIV
jgi:fibronectin type 3 domain-containing protein